MAKIPSYFATEQAETSRLPRAPMEIADIGQGLEAAGLIGFGKALSGLSSDTLQNIINVRSESQFLEGTSQWERAHTIFLTALAKDQDFENYGIKYKAFAKSLRRQILKKGLTTPARRELEEYMENQQVSKEKQMAGLFLAKQRDYGRVSAFQSVINFEQAGDYDGAISAINRARNIGFMSAEEAHGRKQKVQANIESNKIQALINTNPELAMEAIDVLTVDEREKNILRSQARTAIARKQTEAKLRQEQKDDEIGTTFLKLLDNKLEPNKPQLTFDMINNATEMSFDAKTSWFTRLMIFDNYSEAELKEAFTDKGEVLADIYDKIDAGTLTDELDTMVGRGLSPTTAERIKRERRAPFEQRTDKLFKNIFGWSPELGFENDLSSFLYLKTERDWREEIKKQDATGEQIIQIGRAIARPYFIEHLKKTMTGQEADIARMVELALGEELEKTETEVKPKEDEGPRTYQEFEDEVARLKKIDMGKARAFYDAWIEKFTEIKEEPQEE